MPFEPLHAYQPFNWQKLAFHHSQVAAQINDLTYLFIPRPSRVREFRLLLKYNENPTQNLAFYLEQSEQVLLLRLKIPMFTRLLETGTETTPRPTSFTMIVPILLLSKGNNLQLCMTGHIVMSFSSSKIWRKSRDVTFAQIKRRSSPYLNKVVLWQLFFLHLNALSA